jgi:hypothetical protein
MFPELRLGTRLCTPVIHHGRAEYQTGQDFRKHARLPPRRPPLAVVRARGLLNIPYEYIGGLHHPLVRVIEKV